MRQPRRPGVASVLDALVEPIEASERGGELIADARIVLSSRVYKDLASAYPNVEVSPDEEFAEGGDDVWAAAE